MLKLRLDEQDIILVSDHAILKVVEQDKESVKVEVNARPEIKVSTLNRDSKEWEQVNQLPQTLVLKREDEITLNETTVQVFSHTDKCSELRFDAPQSVRLVTIKADSNKQWKNAKKAA